MIAFLFLILISSFLVIKLDHKNECKSEGKLRTDEYILFTIRSFHFWLHVIVWKRSRAGKNKRKDSANNPVGWPENKSIEEF